MIFHPGVRARELRTFARQARTLALADRLESQPLERLQSRQLRLLVRILDHAYRNVPFYRELYRRAGVEPSRVRTIEDLSALPVIDKDQVLANYPDRVLARGHTLEASFRCRSSGTSGVTGVFASDWATRDANFALLYRFRSHFGFRPKHVECVFAFFPGKFRWYRRFGWMRKSAISMSLAPEEAVRRLVEISPDTVYGNPTYLHYLVSLADRPIPVSPMMVISSGEILDPAMKRDILGAFGCPVVDYYGAAEAPFISAECPLHEGQHLNMLNMLVEICRDGEQVGPGEAGDVVVTTLTNTAMPLIRYRLGDVAALSPDECPCGRRGQMLTSIEGRNDDFLLTPSGPRPPIMVRLAATHPKVKGYRIIQETLHRMVVEVLAPDLEDETVATITGKMRQAMGDPDLEVKVRQVDSLPLDPSGKRKVVMSRA